MDLGFLRRLSELRALKLVLGGTEVLPPVTLPALEDLALTQVSGLIELGDFGRFPRLRRLLMQDQQSVKSLCSRVVTDTLRISGYTTAGDLAPSWVWTASAV